MHISQADYDALQKRGCVPPIGKLLPQGSRLDGDGRIVLIIFGEPVAKPRMTQRDKWKQRSCVVRYREWCDLVRAIAGIIPAAENIAAVNWTAFFMPPKSWKKAVRLAAIGQPHRAKPDRDNLDKAVLDCLWKQDSGIHLGTIGKFWGLPGRLEIEIVLSEGE